MKFFNVLALMGVSYAINLTQDGTGGTTTTTEAESYNVEIMLDNLFKALDKDQNGVLSRDEAEQLITVAITESPFVTDADK